MYCNTKFRTKRQSIFRIKKVDSSFLVRLHWSIQNSSCSLSSWSSFHRSENDNEPRVFWCYFANFTQKATGPFEPEISTGLSRKGSLVPSVLVAQSLTGGGRVSCNWTIKWSAWMVFPLINETSSPWKRNCLIMITKSNLWVLNSLFNPKNSVFKDWDARRK